MKRLDPSYGFALHEAVRTGLHFGRDLVFTYGPFGFLTVPTLWWGPTTLGALIFSAVVQTGYCAVLWLSARQLLPRPAALVVVVVTCWLSSVVVNNSAGASAEVLAFVMTAAALLLLGRDVPPTHPRLLLLAGSTVAAVELLAKFDTGLVSLGVLLVAAAFLARHWWIGLVAAAGSFSVAVLLLWLAAGQPLRLLGRFVLTTLDVTSGWPDALWLERPGTEWEYVAAAGLAAGLVAVLLTRSAGHRVAVGLTLAGVLAVGFRHGFVRHDAHSSAFFLALLVVVLAVRTSGRVAVLVRLGLVMAAAAALYRVGAPVRPPLSDRVAAPIRLVSQLADTLVAGRRQRVQEAARQEIRARVPLPPDAVRLLQTGAVYVEPYETGLAWAYGLHWRPAPVFQNNVAATHTLDLLNARFLASANAPEVILRARDPRLEGVHLARDPPASSLAELCLYRPAHVDLRYEVLVRAANRCGPLHPLGRASVPDGAEVDAPSVGTAEAVIVSVDLPSPTPGDALRAALFPTEPSALADPRRPAVAAVPRHRDRAASRLGADTW